MKIFDGMQVNPATLGPTWQGVIGAAMLIGNIVIEADKARCEREAKEPTDTPTGHTTLADVMEQSGLKIPHLQDALTAFMGGTDEAKEVAAMIVEMPDPAKLLREFTRQYRGCATATRSAAAPPPTAANGPNVTPPPATRSEAEPTPSPNTAAGAPSAPAPKLATFRPEFTSEGLAATKAAQAAAGGPPPKLATFRPEFTAEGLAAGKATAAPGPKLAAVRPDSASDSAAVVAVKPEMPAGVGGQSLAEAIVGRLETLTLRRAAHEADLDTRMRCAEAELALLHEELIALRGLRERPILFLVPPPEEAAASPSTKPDEATEPVISATAEDPQGEASAPAAPPVELNATPLVETNAVDGEGVPGIEATTPAVEADAARGEPVVDQATGQESISQGDVHVSQPAVEAAEPNAACVQPALPAPSSDADLARAYVLVDKFSDQQEASYARDSERMRSIERMISTLRGQIETERSLRTAGDHG